MAIANSMAELEQMIMQEMQAAMNEVQAKAEQAEKEEVQSFYSQGSPKIYVRTGKLGKSPRITDVSGGGKSLEFKAWLDQSYGYLVPNPAFTSIGLSSYFTTPEVLDAAEGGYAGVQGKSGFWKRTEERIEKDLDSVFSSHFR